jgi:hypothetical protein
LVRGAGRAITGGSVTLTFSREWTEPPLEDGPYTVLFRAYDGLDQSEPIAQNVTVGGATPGPFNPPGPTPREPNGLSTTAVIAIAVGSVVGVAVVVGVVGCVRFVWKEEAPTGGKLESFELGTRVKGHWGQHFLVGRDCPVAVCDSARPGVPLALKHVCELLGWCRNM